MRGATITLIPLFAAILLVATPSRGEMEFTVGGEFSSGSYGAERTVRTLTLPVSLAWYGERFDLRVEGSFIRQSDPSVTTTLYSSGSRPAVQVARWGSPGGPGGSYVPPTGSSTGSVTTTGSGSVSGPGDTIVRGGMILVDSPGGTGRLRGSLFVKLPTAPDDRGLGTGVVDWGAGLDLTLRLSPFTLMASTEYTVAGRVDGFDLTNYLTTTAGIGARITRSLEPMLLLRHQTPVWSGGGNLLELREKLFWDLSESTFVETLLFQGLSSEAPDWGGGITLGFRFP